MQVQGEVIKKGAKNRNLNGLKNKESFYSKISVVEMVDHPSTWIFSKGNIIKFSKLCVLYPAY